MSTYSSASDAKSAARKVANFIGRTIYIVRLGKRYELVRSIRDDEKAITVKPEE